MVLLLLEAFGALALLLLIVWWTMFSGRKKGELPAQSRPEDAAKAPPPDDPAA
jgi:cbb3-type cytochrome oxidase subunit 3